MTPWQPPVRRVEWLLDMSPAGAGAGLHMSHMLKSAITHHEDPLVAYPGLLEAPLDIEWAEMFASQHALPDGVLNLLVDALNTTPTLALFISMTRHRDMTDMTHLHLQHAGERAFKDAQGSARLPGLQKRVHPKPAPGHDRGHPRPAQAGPDRRILHRTLQPGRDPGPECG